jgi:hypothetical protein
MVAIGGIADIVQHWHEMARSRMTRFGSRALEFAAMRNANLMAFADATDIAAQANVGFRGLVAVTRTSSDVAV